MSNYKLLAPLIGEKIHQVTVFKVFDSLARYPKLGLICQCGQEFTRQAWNVIGNPKNGCKNCRNGTKKKRVVPKIPEIKVGDVFSNLTIVEILTVDDSKWYYAKCRCGDYVTNRAMTTVSEFNGCKLCQLKDLRERQRKLGIFQFNKTENLLNSYNGKH